MVLFGAPNRLSHRPAFRSGQLSMIKQLLDERDMTCGLNCMLAQTIDLDRTFRALADGSRRSVVERLTLGSASVSELARPPAMSLSAVVQHVQVLEACGVVTTGKIGRKRMCRIDLAAISAAEQWISGRRLHWESRLDLLHHILDEEATTTEEHP
jgi:DNA-binding transcriptional ArsR family regulator